eukprot:9477129-Pyramimonas_sp.AAC.1
MMEEEEQEQEEEEEEEEEEEDATVRQDDFVLNPRTAASIIRMVRRQIIRPICARYARVEADVVEEEPGYPPRKDVPTTLRCQFG